MRARLRHGLPTAAPVLLLGLAFLAVALLPAAGHALATPQRPGDHAAALRAHVAWARLVGLALVVLAAALLARLHRRAPARAGAGALVMLVSCAALGAAALHPAYDDALAERTARAYAAPGWSAERMPGMDVPALLYQRAEPAHAGALDVPFPPLRKGDEYRIFVAYADATPEAYWRSRLETGRQDACEPWEGQQPAPPGEAGHGASSLLMRTCSAREDGAIVATARWGSDEAVETRVGAILTPTYVLGVQARLDESIALLGVLGGLLVHASMALSSPRPHLPRASLAALAGAAALACLAWAAAARCPRPPLPPMPHAEAAAAGFALVALLCACAIAALAVASARGALAGRDALRWSSFVLVGLAAFAPVPALHIWRYGAPWVVLGMLGTVLVATLALVAGERLPPRPPRGTGEPAPA